MKKRLIFGAMALCLLLSLAVPAYADETEATEETTVETTQETTEETKAPSLTHGSCGPALEWNLENGVLTVSGSGDMDSGCPWEDHKDSIRKVVFADGVTKVGADAFVNCDNLTVIDFGNTMREIDANAFYDCDGLTQLQLPASFRRFGASCFQECSSLTTVYCAGGMPSFRGNCLWNGNHVTIYTPVNNPWPQESVEELVKNFGGRLEIVSGGESVYTYTEPTEPEVTTVPATEPATEPTEAPTTEAPTTEPATVPTEETLVTEPETSAVPETEPTEAEMEETLVEKAGSSGWVWMVIVAAGVTALLVLALIIRMIIHKDGKYTG